MAGRRRELAIGSRFLDWLFPRHCVRCEREGRLWCRPCDEVYIPRSPKSGCPFCQNITNNQVCRSCRPSVYLDGLISFSAYADPVVRRAIRTWKYDFDRRAEYPIRRWMYKKRPLLTHVRDCDLFTHVPLHISRKRARGFDQAAWIAQTAATCVQSPVEPLLQRTRRTTAQARTNQTQRKLGLLDGSFLCEQTSATSVVLCDDVFTSGATMDAAAKALKEAGVKTVWGLVIAKGSPGGAS